jgi:hypothetical protein
MTSAIHPQPIETRYHGYRFRSRLEARWAVFFDHFQLRWDYEPQGFQLPSGLYLPDFEVDLPDSGLPSPVWVEVKGARPRLHELALTMELAEATQRAVLVVHGQIPWDTNGDGMYLFSLPDGIRTQCYWRRTRTRGLFIEPHRHDGEVPPLDPAVRTAFHRARSARFEFGESGHLDTAA